MIVAPACKFMGKYFELKLVSGLKGVDSTRSIGKKVPNGISRSRLEENGRADGSA